MSVFVIVLLGVLLLMLAIGTFGRESDRGAWWLVVIGVVGVVVSLRIYQIITYFHVWMIYGAMVTLNYAVTFYAAFFLYRDPVSTENEARAREMIFVRPLKVAYIVPVKNEPNLVVRCVRSILNSATYASAHGVDVELIVVNDASTDNTWEVLQQFARVRGVKLVNLSENVGKKEALTIGMCGGENWRDAYNLFEENEGRKPGADDVPLLIELLKSVGCNPPETDICLHTDSDSVVTDDFVFHQAVAFLTNPSLGALSGHCDVWLEPDQKHSIVTKMQVAWYYTQFRVRKAAESAWGHVFCVSGPGAGFRAVAIYPLLKDWVDDWYGPRVYRGATDRMITYLILSTGWDVMYSRIACTNTRVPSTFGEARSQWTRWKQNFWRMLGPVWRFAWHTPAPIAFLTYSRLIIAILASFIMIEHIVAIFLGDFSGSLFYLAGLMLWASIMGAVYVSENPDSWRFGFYRPLQSLVSAFWGSTLTLRALYLDRKRVFAWRDGQPVKPKRGRVINRWFVTTFEIRLFAWIFIIICLIWIIRLIF